MISRDIVVVGTSVGGVQALKKLVKDLPADFPAAVFIVCHVAPDSPSMLAEILNLAGPCPVQQPRDGMRIRPGNIYVAPPDYHMVLSQGHIRVTHEARENRFRPAIDPLFRSAARQYGRRVVAVVLTGALYDGVAGLMAVRAAGGLAIVQAPADAAEPSLPQYAIDVAGADFILALAEIGPRLGDLVREPVTTNGGPTMPDPMDQMPVVIANDQTAQENGQRRGVPSVYTCPECGGVLWQVDDGKLTRFRCHTGHAYVAEQLLLENGEALEAALWTAVRIFRERAVLANQLAGQERKRGNVPASERFEEQGAVATKYGDTIREELLNRMPGVASPGHPVDAADVKNGPPEGA